MHRKCKRDTSENEIVQILRKLGATVEFLDITGGPDLLVGYHGKNFLFEVKTGKRQLRQEQITWFNKWHGHAYVIREPREALEWLGIAEKVHDARS